MNAAYRGDHYYHPDQHGSWSIKAVLPTLCPELSYEQSEGVKDGGMAMDAYAETIHPALCLSARWNWNLSFGSIARWIRGRW